VSTATGPVHARDTVASLVQRGISAAGIMVAATVVSNAANYVYSLVMGRVLGPSVFGGFTALLGVLMILSVASQSVQAVVARYSAGMRKELGDGAVSAFARRLVGRLTLIGIGCFALWLPLTFLLDGALHFEDRLPVIAAGSALILAFTLPVVWGALQGEQRFGPLGANMVLLAVGRLGIGVGLVAVGASLTGAIGALTIATAIAFAVAYPALLRSGGAPPEGKVGPPAREMIRYGLPAVVGLAAWTLLTNLDVVIVKAMAASEEAGYYGAAATVGKMALFLPLAFGLVIFPKAAARHVAGIDSRLLMRRTGQLLLGVSVVFVAAVAVAGDLAIRLMFGDEFEPAGELVVPVVAAMCCFAIANVMLFYYLSVHRMRFAAVMFGLVAIQIGALFAVGSDPLAAAYVQLVVGLAVIAINEIFFVPLVRPLGGNG
jgi:O-antigen/teichoic acid export membrane protein